MSFDPVAQVRRFNRIITAEVGALDNSFLGRSRPLGAARVLNAVGQGITEVTAIRESLGLDSGLTSRLLRALEEEGLVETVPHPDDARRRLARLTPSGRREFDAYEALSNAQAADFLARHPRPGELLQAMNLVASALGRQRMAIVEVDPGSAEARLCLEAYYAELARRFPNGFEVSLSRDPDAEDMVRPRGAFLLARSERLAMGCVGLKGGDGGIAEIKRLWVAPHARSLGLARQLLETAEGIARDLSFRRLRLDTNSALSEAQQLYRRNGWMEIDRYNDDPYPDTFYEKYL